MYILNPLYHQLVIKAYPNPVLPIYNMCLI